MIQKEKIICLGEYYRHYIYSPFKLIRLDEKKGRTKLDTDEYEKNKQYYAEVAKRCLRDIVLSNLPYGKPRFMTLTYASPQFSNQKAKENLKLFIKRLRYHLEEQGHDHRFRYIAVSEQHDSETTDETRRYSYHFHILLFDLPYLRTAFYAEIWKHGFIKINLIRGSAFSTASYLTKYLTKTTAHKRGERRYLVSRNVYRPKEVSFDQLPILFYVKGVNYPTFTGSMVRVDYYKAQLQEQGILISNKKNHE